MKHQKDSMQASITKFGIRYEEEEKEETDKESSNSDNPDN